MAPALRGPVLLTGATGFVGRYLHPALVAAGAEVVCGTRRPDRAREREPDRRWIELDVERPETLGRALRGCRAAFYLVHGVASGPGYGEREAAAARAFRAAAAEAGLERLIYLGAIAPAGPPSRHLRSRLETGAILREGPVPCLELRAGMIVGAGSASWLIVRDLAGRLPVMVLPAWLRNLSEPVAIEDVVGALLLGLVLSAEGPRVLDVPGPERLSHRALLLRVARRMKGRAPLLIDVPVLTPRLSSYWIRLVTRADGGLATELVEGLTSDILARPETVWRDAPGHRRVPLDEAIERALADERAEGLPSPRARAAVEALGRSLAAAGGP